MRSKLVAALVTAAFLGTTWGAPSAGAATTTKAWATPNLAAGFIPQGMTIWGKYVVMAEYKPGANTRLVAVDPNNGKTYGQVAISENHSGGIAVVGGWLFVQDQPHMAAEAIRRYDMRTISAGFLASHKAKNHPTYAGQVGLQQLDNWQFASFMATDGDQILAGHYNNNVEGARMYRYDVDQKTGHATAVTGYTTVPLYTQGVAMFGKIPVYASHLLLTYGSKHIAIPDHAEGLVILKGTAYVSFEGGSKYVLKIKL